MVDIYKMSNNQDYIILSYADGVRDILFNRPDRKNALCASMYATITKVLNEDAIDDKVVVTIITGAGSYFTSGNDLKGAVLNISDGLNLVKSMVDAFINYPKLLIAVVNGPAVGIGATMAGLCDIVYATDAAVFDTPFVRLGLCAEAASSFTFPSNLGRSKASEVLLLNHKLNAQEAYQFGLVSDVFPYSALNDFIDGLRKYGRLPVKNIIANKQLIMANFKPILYKCNNREVTQLLECIESEEFAEAVTKFFNRSKL